MKKKFYNNLNLVLLLHDVSPHLGQGLLTNDKGSKYLLKKSLIKESLKKCKESNINFFSLNNHKNYFDQKDQRLLLSVDDGGKSNIWIAELLSKSNIKGVFFIPTKYIGDHDFLSKSEIKLISDLGHIIGSHSHSHPNPFFRLSKETISEEINISTSILEDIIQKRVNKFSVPGGEVNNNCLHHICNSHENIDELYTSLPHKGEYKRIGGTRVIGRLCIENGMSSNNFLSFANGKGWLRNKLYYQTSRLKREFFYNLSDLLINK